MTMTGARLKEVLEDVADNLFNPDPYYQQGGDMVRVGGVRYTIDIGKPIGSRISDLTLLQDRQAARSEPRTTSSPAGRASTRAPRARRSGTWSATTSRRKASSRRRRRTASVSPARRQAEKQEDRGETNNVQRTIRLPPDLAPRLSAPAPLAAGGATALAGPAAAAGNPDEPAAERSRLDHDARRRRRRAHLRQAVEARSRTSSAATSPG